MAAVSWSGDPEPDWQLDARAVETSRSIRGANWGAPLDGVAERPRELGGLLSPIRYKWNSKPTTKGLAGALREETDEETAGAIIQMLDGAGGGNGP